MESGELVLYLVIGGIVLVSLVVVIIIIIIVVRKGGGLESILFKPGDVVSFQSKLDKGFYMATGEGVGDSFCGNNNNALLAKIVDEDVTCFGAHFLWDKDKVLKRADNTDFYAYGSGFSEGCYRDALFFTNTSSVGTPLKWEWNPKDATFCVDGKKDTCLCAGTKLPFADIPLTIISSTDSSGVIPGCKWIITKPITSNNTDCTS